MKTDLNRVYKITLAGVYPHYIAKVEKKGREAKYIVQIFTWLTGYTDKDLERILIEKQDFETIFNNAPQINPHVHLITGTICGYKVQEITDPILQKIRYLDKLIDELAKGKAMDKILRS